MSDEDRRVSGNLIAFLKGPETQFSSVTQSCPTLCDPMGYSTPGLPVPHHLPKLAQVHVHCFCAESTEVAGHDFQDNV